MIPDSFKQDLLNRIDVVEVVSRFVQLKRGGANYQGLCPFHAEKTPSFTVSPAKQFYHCFGCGAHGNAIGFLMSYGGMGYVDAIKDLASGAGMQVPEWQPTSTADAQRKERETDLLPLMDRAMHFYRAELKNSPRAIEYLKRRGLTGEVAARFRIGYAPDDWQGLKATFPDYADKSLVECGLVIESENRRYDRFRDRIMFPILNSRGAVIGFGARILDKGEPKYLNSPETALFEKGREVYGLVQAREAIRSSGRVLVVEGYMDVVALAQFDVRYAVATLGTATTPVHVSKLLRLADELVFCFDGDAAGRKAAWRALEQSLPLATDAKPIRFLFLPDGDDPDTFVRANGTAAFEKMVREAHTLSEFLLGELRAQADLATAEGRSQFLSVAKPHVHKVAAPALRLQVVKEIAVLARVSQQEAEGLLDVRQEAARFTRQAPARIAAAATTNLERKLLRLLLERPQRAAEVNLALTDPGVPESLALGALATWCAEQSVTPTQAMMIERFQGSPHEELLFDVQQSLLGVRLTEAEADQEFDGCLQGLREQRKREEVEALRRRAERGEAGWDEWQRKRIELDELSRGRSGDPAVL